MLFSKRLDGVGVSLESFTQSDEHSRLKSLFSSFRRFSEDVFWFPNIISSDLCSGNLKAKQSGPALMSMPKVDIVAET